MTTQIGRGYPENFQICPFLGLMDDEQTSFAFPSDWNNCYRCKPVGSVNLEHQRKYCLLANHQNCIVYIQISNDPLPRDLRNQRPAYSSPGKSPWKALLILASLAFLFALGWILAPQLSSMIGPAFVQTASQTPLQPAVSPTPLLVKVTPSPEFAPSPKPVIPFASAVPSFTPVSSDFVLLSTSLPSILATPTITRIPHDIETLVGLNYIFRIHRVKQGESLDLLAHMNGTTIAAISAVNYNFSTPLWVQQVVIIPVNQTDVSELPSFEAYRVSEDTTVEALAAQLNVDAVQLQYYNGLGSSPQLAEGEWLVIPREKNK